MSKYSGGELSLNVERFLLWIQRIYALVELLVSKK